MSETPNPSDGGPAKTKAKPAPPQPPPPSTPQKPAGNKAGRSSYTSQAERRARVARILQLRSANVPVRQIAQMLGMRDAQVRKVIEDDYRANAEWAAAAMLLRKYEREHQLEMMDSMLMQGVIGIDPAVLTGAKQPPPNAPVPTISVRDYLSIFETSRRFKQDLIRLHALDGVTAVADKAGQGQAVPGDKVYEERIIRQFLEQLKEHEPALYDGVVTAFIKRDGQAPGGDGDLPLPGGEHMPDRDGEEDDVQAP